MNIVFEPRQQIILYGAGTYGLTTKEFIELYTKGIDVFCFCDQRHNDLKSIQGINVLSFEECINTRLPFIVCASKKSVQNKEMVNNLVANNCEYYTDLFSFINQNGTYISASDYQRYFYNIIHTISSFYTEDATIFLNTFWNEKSEFIKFFNKLDLDRIVELGAGSGHQVEKYIERANDITLVDMSYEGLEICRKRYGDNPKVHYYWNNGRDMSNLPDNYYSSLFSYDSMTFVSLRVLIGYLDETFRILKHGSYALFHHSNVDNDYMANRINVQVGNRNYMSKDLFAHIAYDSGFQVIEQKIITYAGIENMDCITLLLKP